MAVSFQHSQTAQIQAESHQRLLLFDLDARGHHPGYIQHLVRFWCEQKLSGQLDVLVTPQFLEKHGDVVDTASQPIVKFIAITSAEEVALVAGEQLGNSFKGRIQRAFQDWNILRKYLIRLQTTHCLIMYLDTILLRLALGAKFPCQFSSIYFRPVFHYSQFQNFTPTPRERFWQLRDQVCLSRLLKNPQLHTLFCLDPFAAEQINRVNSQHKAVHLIDPVHLYSNLESEIQQLKRDFEIQPHRKVFLMFGVLSKRKGMFELLDAITQLPSDICQTLCLLLIGPLELENKAELEERIQHLVQSKPVQIICRHTFIRDDSIQNYFQIADVILAPYQRHIGMSAILVRAAAAGKPVLASDFGLMGEVTRHHELGLTVDSTVPAEIAKGIIACLNVDFVHRYNSDKMQRFAEHNQTDKFAKLVFDCLLDRFYNHKQIS